MILLFYILLLAPLSAFFISLLFSNEKERSIYLTAISAVLVNYVTIIVAAVYWIQNGFEPLVIEGPTLYHSGHTNLGLHFMIDGFGLAYFFTASFLTGVIINFSKTYVHREKGYKRFYNNIIFFYFGISLVLLSGNLETLFIGWEILGVTSFFLIGFYRERYLPVKNALKVVSLYRIADLAILLAIWLSHHYFESSVMFHDMNNMYSSHDHILSDTYYIYLIPGFLLLAAMIKSTQFPFSSWLPRAMEGPTTSTSIFYGSLSAHIGVFLLIRTAPFWESNYWFHFIIGIVGVITAIVCSLIARVQPSIKTEIAYSSSAQIGVMFIEVACGLYWLAIIHFIGNALLRSHQLLISPSVLSYKIHQQMFHFSPMAIQGKESFWDKVKLSLYILSVKEFNLDTFMYNFFWNPFKKMGAWTQILSIKMTLSIFLPIYIIGMYLIYNQHLISDGLYLYLPFILALLSFFLILKAFVERASIFNAWFFVIMSQLYVSLALGFNEVFDVKEIYLFISGILIFGFIGFLVIYILHKKNEAIDLDEFHGHIREYPGLALVFLISSLAILGFPISPTFIGEELLLNHVHENQFFLLILLIINLILVSWSIYRLYSRLFRGQHKSDYHDFAYKSS